MNRKMPRIGDRFCEAARPAIAWRVSAIRNDVITLAREDKPTIERYLDSANLLDSDRYRKA